MNANGTLDTWEDWREDDSVRAAALAEELSVEQIATRVGFGNAATLRHHFSAQRGVTPQQYRQTFCGVPA